MHLTNNVQYWYTENIKYYGHKLIFIEDLSVKNVSKAKW